MSKKSGRILTHQRVTESVPLLGDDGELDNDFKASVQETLSHDLADKTRRNCRNRIKHIIEYWKGNIDWYHKIGVVAVSPNDMKDPTKYYYNKFDEDIRCTGLNPNMVKKFLSHTKSKGNGNIKSYGDIRKYKDAIVWGSKMAEQPLPPQFLSGTRIA